MQSRQWTRLIASSPFPLPGASRLSDRESVANLSDQGIIYSPMARSLSPMSGAKHRNAPLIYVSWRLFRNTRGGINRATNSRVTNPGSRPVVAANHALTFHFESDVPSRRRRMADRLSIEITIYSREGCRWLGTRTKPTEPIQTVCWRRFPR